MPRGSCAGAGRGEGASRRGLAALGFASWEEGEREIRKLGKVGKGDENDAPVSGDRSVSVVEMDFIGRYTIEVAGVAHYFIPTALSDRSENGRSLLLSYGKRKTIPIGIQLLEYILILKTQE